MSKYNMDILGGFACVLCMLLVWEDWAFVPASSPGTLIHGIAIAMIFPTKAAQNWSCSLSPWKLNVVMLLCQIIARLKALWL